MSQQHLMIFAVAVVILVFFVYFAIWTSRFVRVAPNQVLIVSGRKVQRPDGSFAGFRIVKSGGTFVFPVIERADVLSLEVMAVEMPGAKGRTADGRGVQVDNASQGPANRDGWRVGLPGRSVGRSRFNSQ